MLSVEVPFDSCLSSRIALNFFFSSLLLLLPWVTTYSSLYSSVSWLPHHMIKKITSQYMTIILIVELFVQTILGFLCWIDPWQSLLHSRSYFLYYFIRSKALLEVKKLRSQNFEEILLILSTIWPKCEPNVAEIYIFFNTC